MIAGLCPVFIAEVNSLSWNELRVPVTGQSPPFSNDDFFASNLFLKGAQEGYAVKSSCGRLKPVGGPKGNFCRNFDIF
jgi:hypothetical protein